MITKETEKPFNGKNYLPVEISEETQHKGWGYRHQQCLILLCCITTAYSVRVYIGVSLVAMTENSHVSTQSLLNTSLTFMSVNGTHYDSINNSIINDHDDNIVTGLLFTPPYPKFQWNKKVQDTIQSSFFWGYMILQIPAGQLVHYLGPRNLLTFALLVNCIMAIISPWAACYGGWISLIVCRIIQGLGQAFVLPSVHHFLGKWAPLEERGRLSATILGGQAIGTVLGIPLTGLIASSSLGWPGIFRFYGILSGIVGCCIWWFIADSPAKHRSISAAERQYIEEKLGQTHSKKRRPVPWGKILRCRGLYANIIAHIGTTWGQLTLFSEVPSFMDKVMGLNIKANGLLSGLPFLIMWFTNSFFSWLADMLIVKKYLSVVFSRKLANSIGSIPPAIGLVALAYAPKNIYVVEVILIFICSFKTATHVGFFVNHIDITPNYSGTMLSISNFVANLCGSAAPLVAGFILSDPTDTILWRKVFFISAGMYFFTNLVYVTFGTTEKADWNDPEEDPEDIKDDKLEDKTDEKLEVTEPML